VTATDREGEGEDDACEEAVRDVEGRDAVSDGDRDGDGPPEDRCDARGP
jgi:hypothetical protein